ncbi:MFS transporter [Natronorubrum sp. JWXQ-INN-674]|uniref:MFS transporter n=1 Tax=Natronorubrum halalkaliphilum TaxID=2691917 RepID=A0A6B0VHC7_9EURY|nr:MFS transporter [Natronorubrum halalkaliphilum]MXV60515.1 MFS transporter [Natronorubrum halalkaliphilum]
MRWSYQTTVLVSCTLAFFVTFFARLTISPVIPLIIEDFQTSNTLVGMALTGMWLAYGLSQYPSGILADRFGERSIILIAVGGSVLASLFIALAPMFAVFLIATISLGAVAGLHYSVATALLSRTYDDVGTAVGLHSAGAPLAGFLAPLAAAWVGIRYGWQPAVALGALVGLPVFALFYVSVRPTDPVRPDQAMRERLTVRPIVRFLSRPPIAFTLVIAITSTFVVQGLMSFLPTFLVVYRDYSAGFAGVLFSAYFVVRGTAQLAIGSLSDRHGRDSVLAGSMIAGGSGLVILVTWSGVLALSVGIVLIGIGAAFFPALDPRFLDELSEDERNIGFGLVRTVYVVFGASGSVGLGFFADAFGWGASFIILAGLYFLAFCALGVNYLLELGY